MTDEFRTEMFKGKPGEVFRMLQSWCSSPRTDEADNLILREIVSSSQSSTGFDKEIVLFLIYKVKFVRTEDVDAYNKNLEEEKFIKVKKT